MIIFVTAFDRYALDAFEAQALDYLLKPINDTRFAQALERVRSYWRQQRRARAARETDAAARRDAGHRRRRRRSAARSNSLRRREPQYPGHPADPRRRGTVRLDVTQIDWIDAAGDYMCVHADGRTYVLRETMKSLEAVLDPKIFQRVHRSTIVNVRRVRRLRPHTNGEYFLTLDDGQEIKLSRSYRDRVDQLLQRSDGDGVEQQRRRPTPSRCAGRSSIPRHALSRDAGTRRPG